MFDLSWITKDLAVGGALPDGDLRPLAEEHGVKNVVDLRSEASDEPGLLRRHGVELLALPTKDFAAVTPAMIDEGVSWIEEAVARGERVLVHCQLGIGRSVLLVLCYLVRTGLSAPEAMLHVKDRREQASPSPKQIDALLEYEERARGRRSNWDDVAAQAYRHLPGWGRAR